MKAPTGIAGRMFLKPVMVFTGIELRRRTSADVILVRGHGLCLIGIAEIKLKEARICDRHAAYGP